MKFKYSNRVLPAAACAALATAGFAIATPAQAFDFKVSGQVDRAVIAADNGEKSDVGFVDNEGGNSRFRFTGSQDMDNGLTVGFTYEIAITANPSSSWDIGSHNTTNGDKLDQRLANVWVQGDWGKFTFGKIWTAGGIVSEFGYSSTIGFGGGIDAWGDYAASISGLDGNGNTITTIGDVVRELSEYRANGVKYQTPDINGFTLGFGFYDGHSFDIAPSYETTFGDGGKAGVKLSYEDTQDANIYETPAGITPPTLPNGDPNGNRYKQYGGAASVQLPVGVNFTAAYRHRAYSDNDIPDPDTYYGGIGYEVGKHGVLLDYTQTDDFANRGSKGKSAGLSYDYRWTDSITLYASYHHWWLDNINNAATGFNDVDAQGIDTIYAGVYLKFL